MVLGFRRYRSKGTPLEMVPVKVRRLQPEAWAVELSENRAWCAYWEEMWDNPGKKSDYHEVLHLKTFCNLAKIRKWELDPGPPVGFSKWDATPYWVPRSSYFLTHSNIVSWLDNTDYERGSERWQDFTMNAFNSITEQIPQVADLPNMLRDLFTVKGLLKQLCKLGTKMLKILSELRAYRGSFSHLLTLRQLMKNLADGFLINQFGIQPMIGQFQGMLSRAASALRRFDFLRKTQGSTFTARYSESIPLSGVTRNLGTADDASMADTCIWLKDVSGAITYTCTAKIRNSLRGLEGLMSGVRMALGALGGRTIASFMWDLVPWSFVVDWVFNVSALLDKYAAVDPFAGSLEVLSAGTAFKKVVTGSLVLEGGDLVMGSIPFGNVSITQYERRRGLDSGVNFFTSLSEMTPHQASILSALVIQRT